MLKLQIKVKEKKVKCFKQKNDKVTKESNQIMLTKRMMSVSFPRYTQC